MLSTIENPALIPSARDANGIVDFEFAPGHDEAWITVESPGDIDGGSMSILIKRTYDGVVIDVYPLGDENETIASTWATWGEAYDEDRDAPVREGMYRLKLRGYGNPDYRQYTDIAPIEYYEVATVDEAIALCDRYQQEWELTLSNWGPESGILTDHTGAQIGRVNWRGEVEMTIGDVEVKAKVA